MTNNNKKLTFEQLILQHIGYNNGLLYKNKDLTCN